MDKKERPLKRLMGELKKKTIQLEETKKNLEESEGRYRNLFENSPNIIFTLDLDGRINLVNKTVENLVDYNREEIIGKHFKKFVPSKYPPSLLDAFEKEIRGIAVPTMEIEVMAKDGETIPIELLHGSVPIKEKGKLVGIQITARDLRERKETEKKLEESEQKYRDLFENASDILFTLDRLGRFTNGNKRAEEISGYKREELIGKSFKKIVPLKYAPKILKLLQKGIKGEIERGEIEIEIKDKKGRLIPIEMSGRPIWKNGKIIGVQGIARDITERKKAETRRKRAEEALRASETEKKTILDAMSDIVLFQDTNLSIRWGNEAAGRSVGKTQQELVGCYCYELWHGRSEPCEGCPVLRALETGSHATSIMTTPDGRWWEITGEPVHDRDGKIVGAIEIARDITERRKTEEKLKDSEERFRHAFEESEIGKVLTDLDGHFQRFNNSFCQMLGYTEEELLSKEISDITHPDDTAVSREHIKRLIEGKFKGDTFTLEKRYLRKDGRTIWGRINVVLIRDRQGKPLGMMGELEDFTERKRAEEALRKERDKAQKYLDVANTIMVVIGSDQKASLINRKGCEVFGYEEEEILGKNWFDSVVPERIRDEIKTIFAKLMAGEVEPIEYFEHPMLTSSGEEKIIAWHNTVLKDEEGKIIATLSSGEDVTELKRSEKALRESEEKFKILFKENPSPQVYLDENIRILDINSRFKELFGYELDEIKGKHIDDVVVPEEMMEEAEDLNEKAEKGYFYHETVRESKDGRKIPVSISGISMILKGRKQYITTYEGITERKKAEEAIKESEERYRTLTENIDVGIYRNTPGLKGRFIEANPAIVKMFDYDNKKEFLKLNVSDLYQNPEDRKKLNEKIMKDGFVRNEEIQLKKKDGTPIWGSVAAVAIYDENGKIKYYDGLIDDITKRKEMEEELKKSYEETKKALERERKFIDETSHNFFNPLCIAKGYLVLQLERDIPEETRKEIESAKRAVERIEKIVKKSVGRG